MDGYLYGTFGAPMNIKAMLSGASDSFADAGFALRRLDRELSELGVTGEHAARELGSVQRNLRAGMATLRRSEDSELIGQLTADIKHLGEFADGVRNLRVAGRGIRSEFGPTLGEALLHTNAAGKASDLRQGIGVPLPKPNIQIPPGL